MKMAVIVMFIFGIAIGAATFIENDFGTQSARALIYKTKWFEWFLAYFTIILIYQIIKYKSYKTRFPVFLFHLSFVVIAVGALITRYIGYEGIMHIREGQSSDKMISDSKMLQIYAKSNDGNASFEMPLYLSTMTKNHIEQTLQVGSHTLKIKLLNYLPTTNYKVAKDDNGKTVLELKISNGDAGEFHYISSGEIKDFDTYYIAYNAKNLPKDKPVFNISGDSNLSVDFPFSMNAFSMDTKEQKLLPTGKNNLHTRTLYSFGGVNVVLKSINPKSKIELYSDDLKTQSSKPEYIKWKVDVDGKTKELVTKPLQGQLGVLHKLSLNGVDVSIRVGAKLIKLPFSIKLTDFQLERYPGSMTPASYASEVVLVDKEQNINQPFRIYMNHVLDHRGYRFFQSSYDPDEGGTILSVNHDPGTLPTYFGYLLLMVGMIWSLFIPNGRFQMLLKGARKLQNSASSFIIALLFALAINTTPTQAATPIATPDQLKQMKAYDEAHATKFGTLVVQDSSGRMKPLDTFAQEIISKIPGTSKPFGLSVDQIFLGMMLQPDLYHNVDMIKIGHPKIALDLGLSKDTKYAKFNDFFNDKGRYKLYDKVNVSNRKKPLEKSQYDKELIKADERLNVAYMAYSGDFLRIFPKPNDPNNKWYSPLEAMKSFDANTSADVQLRMQAYFVMVAQGLKSAKWDMADKALLGIKQYQKKYGSSVIPSDKHIEMEIWYNKLGLFSKLFPIYLTLGMIVLIFAFVNVLKPTFSINKIMKVSWIVLIVAFIVHVIGMGIRWYIAGHAPWSNAYESIVFIGAATVFAGIVLAKNSPFALAGTALLAGFTMLVAHLNFINPQITTLVPVLKSYWLMIHVATIISGDGFLGLGSMLSLMVLVLYIIRGKNGHTNIDRAIKELSNLAEMSLIIGLMLMTVVNFLCVVWANESWVRYWGWDPKETWAAVTILIYAVVLHLRFIPKLNDRFVFNVASTWAYSTVLMTYFGVNYYLSGLHSYAAGDPVPIPAWVYYAVAGLFVLTIAAARNRKLSYKPH
jgi:cytochrome c-type biogenesis protein CcsB